MGYYIIIRGHAGAGKTTIAKAVAKRLGALYISVDKILKDHGLDVIEYDCISERNFERANEIALKEAVPALEKGGTVVFDGNFYHLSQLKHLKRNLPHRHMVFMLKASLEECVKRDRERAQGKIGEDAIRAVYGLVESVQEGEHIETGGKTEQQVEEKIVSLIPGDVRKQSGLSKP